MILYFCILVICIFIYIRLRWKNQNSPPGPFPWPVVGNLRMLRRRYKEFGGQHKAFSQLAKEYASNVIKLRLGSSDVIVVSGYNVVQKIQRDENFDARPWNEFAKIRNMGLRKGITMGEGPEWREVRAWLVRCLKSLSSGRVGMSCKILDELSSILDSLRSEKSGPVKLEKLISPAVINFIWSIVTGKRIDDNKRLRYFFDLMERRARAFDMAGGLLSVFPWIRHVAPKKCGYELLITVNTELKDFLMETINEHKQNYVEGKEMDLIDMFLKEMYSGKGPEAGFTEDQLMIILVDIFIAGSQTTQITLDFLFLYMTVHQDVQKKIHKELDSVINCDRFPQMSDRPLLPYMEAVMTETQRLCLVVPITGPRRALKDTTLDGYMIPKNSCILMNLYSIHMNPENFENPHSFEPERFLKGETNFADKKLIFFGGGHRRCPGESVAKSVVFLLFAGIMKNYNLLPVSGKDLPDLEPKPGLTISPKPYEIQFQSRTCSI